MSCANYLDMDQQLETANDPLASWQSYAPSVQGDGYAEFGSAVQSGFDDLPEDPQYALLSVDKPNYVCLHSGCGLGFDNDLALDRHMTAHFDQGKLPAAGAAADQPSSARERGPTQPFLASDRVSFNRDGKPYECPVRDCAVREYSYSTLEHHRRTHFLRGNKYMCQFEGCGRGFNRWADLPRHEKGHLPDAPKHDCPDICCDYKGRKGFARRDKLMDHCRNQHGYPAAPRANRLPRRAAQTSAVVTTAATPASTVAPSMAGST